MLALSRFTARRLGVFSARTLRSLRPNSTAAAAGAAGGAPKEPPKKGIRLLMAKYGYSALGVYLGLSAIDLPLSFLFVHSVGPERLEVWMTQAKEYLGFDTSKPAPPPQEDVGGALEPDQPPPSTKWFGIDRVLLAEFGVAYALHKSLIFARVPITAALTPVVVRQLQAWGFKIGQGAATATAVGTKATGKQRFGSWFF